ncbi:MAG: hypothetical protein L0271_03440 [Gemmatimonadetes bacterium]|nr:hypothetical protein [Gemmatimonadota bacterium]
MQRSLILVILASAACNPTATLRLHEARTLTLPDGFQPNRISVASNSSAVLLSTATRQAVLIEGTTLTTIEMQELMHPVRIRITGDGPDARIDVLDVGRQATLRYSRTGLLAEIHSPVDGTIFAAAGIADGWYVARQAANVLRIEWLNEHGASRQLHRFAQLPARAQSSAPLHLSISGSELLVSLNFPPFRLVGLDTIGRTTLDAVAEQQATEQLSPHISIEVAYPAVRYDDMILQSVADLHADVFAVNVYDEDGRYQRRSVLPHAAVIAGASTDSPFILMLRNLGNPEVAYYTVQ